MRKVPDKKTRKPHYRNHVPKVFAPDCCRRAYHYNPSCNGALFLLAFPILVMLYSVMGNYKNSHFDATCKLFVWPEHRLYDARIACHNHRPQAKLEYKPHLSEFVWKFDIDGGYLESPPENPILSIAHPTPRNRNIGKAIFYFPLR